MQLFSRHYTSKVTKGRVLEQQQSQLWDIAHKEREFIQFEQEVNMPFQVFWKEQEHKFILSHDQRVRDQRAIDVVIMPHVSNEL